MPGYKSVTWQEQVNLTCEEGEGGKGQNSAPPRVFSKDPGLALDLQQFMSLGPNSGFSASEIGGL